MKKHLFLVAILSFSGIMLGMENKQPEVPSSPKTRKKERSAVLALSGMRKGTKGRVNFNSNLISVTYLHRISQEESLSRRQELQRISKAANVLSSLEDDSNAILHQEPTTPPFRVVQTGRVSVSIMSPERELQFSLLRATQNAATNETV